MRWLFAWVIPPEWLYRVQWPTREGRPELWADKAPSTASMLRALPDVVRRHPDRE